MNEILVLTTRVNNFTIEPLYCLGSRSTSDDANKIVVNIPVHAMNLPQVFTEVKRDIAISLYIGDSKMWAGYQEFTIKEAAASAPTTNDVSITDVRLLNKEPMRKGDGATYRITVTVPVGWSNFDVEIEGDAGEQKFIAQINDTSVAITCLSLMIY